VFPSGLPGVNLATLNGMILYYRLMTKRSGLGDSTKLSRMGLPQGCPLKIVFPHLFEICNQQDWSVRRVCNPEFGDLTFRRNFGVKEAAEFSDLMELINSVTLSETRDSVQWVLEKSGAFSTSSLYNELTFTGFSNRWLMNVWKTKVPLKIRIFLWKVINDKIQSAEQLKKRNWPGSVACKLCGMLESTSHIFFPLCACQFLLVYV
jgi:hypothetical protein